MGKRKRDDDDILKSLLKKAKKLVKKRRRRISSSTSEEDPPNSLPKTAVREPASEPLAPTSPPPLASASASFPAPFLLQDSSSDLELQDEIPANTTTVPLVTDIPPASDGNLEPDVLQLLGADPTQENKLYGDNLHQEIATRWNHILLNGLAKDEKSEILKKYLPAENCSHMKAPLLNREVKSALSEDNTKRDAYSEKKKNQMSSCISAIGKALNLILTQTEDTHEIIRTLSDAGRLLCDTYYRESLSRRFNIVNTFNKRSRDILKGTEIDEYLFGSNLTEHLKSTKAVSATASELRFTNRFNQQRLLSNSSTQAQGQALNARGALRAASAAEPRVYPPPDPSRRPNPPAYQPPPPPLPAARPRRAPATAARTNQRSRNNAQYQQPRRR